MTTPYRFASGEARGEPEAPAAAGMRSSTDRPPRTPGRLHLIARRFRTDPSWVERSRESRRMLIDQDARDEAFLRERGAR